MGPTAKPRWPLGGQRHVSANEIGKCSLLYLPGGRPNLSALRRPRGMTGGASMSSINRRSANESAIGVSGHLRLASVRSTKRGLSHVLGKDNEAILPGRLGPIQSAVGITENFVG